MRTPEDVFQYEAWMTSMGEVPAATFLTNLMMNLSHFVDSHSHLMIDIREKFGIISKQFQLVFNLLGISFI